MAETKVKHDKNMFETSAINKLFNKLLGTKQLFYCFPAGIRVGDCDSDSSYIWLEMSLNERKMRFKKCLKDQP